MTKKPTETPYLNAKKEFNEREGSRNASHQLSKIINILCLIIALTSIGGLVYYRSLFQFVPYVIEVDKLGQTYAVARADRAAPADPRVIHATVARFITLARMVTPDATLQRKAIFDLYASLASSDPATFKMNEFLGAKSEENPFKRAAKETVEIQITHPTAVGRNLAGGLDGNGPGPWRWLSTRPLPNEGVAQSVCRSPHPQDLGRAVTQKSARHFYPRF